MKLAKRILLPVLVIALLASVFAVSSVADDNREYDYTLPSITKAEQILEYYALDDYLADNYEDDTWNTDLFNAVKVVQAPKYSVAADPTAADNKVLSVTLPRARTSVAYTLKSTEGLLTDKLIVSTKIYFDATATKGLNFTLQAGLQNELDSNIRYYDIINLDMKTGALKYSGWDSTSQTMVSGANTYEGFTAQTGVWYDFLITFNAEDDVYKFTVKSVPTDGSEPEVLASIDNIAIDGAVGMGGFDLKATASSTNVSFCFDDVEIYEGTTTRSPSYKDENTEIHVADLINFYNEETTDFATKLRIADVFYDLSNLYGVALPADAYVQMNETLAVELVDRIGKINPELDFYQRKAWFEEVEKYNVKVPTNEDLLGTPGITEEIAAAVVEARVAYFAEKAVIDLVKEHSENFIDFMTNVYDPECTDYIQMKVWFAELNDEYVAENPEFADYDTEKYPYQTRFYTKADAAYGEIPQLKLVYDSFVAKINEIEATVNSFVEYVNFIEENSASFGPRYSAFVQATEIYNDGVVYEGLDNDTHPVLAERIAYYLRVAPSIITKRDQCELFIELVKQASIASYYTVLVEKLDLAVAAYANIALDYENMVAYVDLFTELRSRRAGIEAEAAGYIDAVKAIEEAQGFDAKKEAVNNAAKLKVRGDVLGYAGVEEANIIFSTAKADVEFREYSSLSLISLVAEIKATESISARRKLLALAETAYENAEDEYKGVDIAKEVFLAEKEAFKADVAAANASIIAATDAAAAIASAVNGAAIFN